MCSICRSASRDAANAEIGAGTSLRQVARKFGFSRAATQRHASGCLKLRRNLPAEAREAARKKHGVLSADLDAEYTRVEKLRAAAETSGDTAAILKCSRHLARLLGMRQRAVGRLPSEVLIDATSQIDARLCRIIFDSSSWPEDLRHVGGPPVDRTQNLPEDASVIIVKTRICFQRETKENLSAKDRAAEAAVDKMQAALDLAAKIKAAGEPN